MKKHLSMLLTLTALLCRSEISHAGGFALVEQSVSSMGSAYAGGAALAEDASTAYFNPAGLTRICGWQTVSGTHLVLPYAKFHDHGSIEITEQPLIGGNGGNPGEISAVSHYYIAGKINNCWSVGLGFNSPFGLATDYKHGWKGRYHALRSEIFSVNINPSIAYRFNECWSIGAGLNAMYFHAKLSNAVDFGLIGFVLHVPEIEPQTIDGHVSLKGDSWGYGGNVGVLWEPCCGTRVGAHYRSQVKQNVKGTEKFKHVPDFVQNVPILREAFIHTHVKVNVKLPATASLSGYHEFSDCWAVMGDITWTQWSCLKDLHFVFKNRGQSDGYLTLRWKNTMRYALGTHYRPNSCLTLRMGAAYDESPVKNKRFATPRIPDANRIWTAFGLGYDYSRCLHFDIGYAHLFFKDPKIDRTAFLPEDQLRGGLRGKYHASVDILSFQSVWQF